MKSPMQVIIEVNREVEAQELQHLKENLLKLVKEHKDNCHSPECGISLFYVRKLAEKAGVTFTEDEKRNFM